MQNVQKCAKICKKYAKNMQNIQNVQKYAKHAKYAKYSLYRPSSTVALVVPVLFSIQKVFISKKLSISEVSKRT